MRPRVREVVETVGLGAQGAGGDLVQQRFPDVGERAVHQGDPRLALPAESAAELGREDEAARAAADHDDVVRRGKLRVGAGRLPRRRRRRALLNGRHGLAWGGRNVPDHRRFSSWPAVKPLDGGQSDHGDPARAARRAF
jgi:hypothetical protein